MQDQVESLGFVKYEWGNAPGGVIDANAGGSALIAIDEAMRFFNRKQSRGFGATPYEIPVRTIDGSWEVVVIGLIALSGAFATGYAKKAGEKMAERDFSDLGFKDIARKSIEALEYLVELVKHTKRVSNWEIRGSFRSRGVTMIGVLDEKGDVFYVPAEFLKWYYDLPRSTLKKLITPISKGRSMTVGARSEQGLLRSVEFTIEDVNSLDENDDPERDEYLFPEFRHGDNAVLEGIVTRGNQETNSMGFQYKGHILNCVPETGSIRRYKSAMFLHCRIESTINRHVASLIQPDRRPTLIVKQVEILENDPNQKSLFK